MDSVNIDPEYLDKLKKYGFPHFERYSTVWERFFANIIDGVILGIVLIPLGFWVMEMSTLENVIMLSIVFSLIVDLTVYAYSIVLHGKFGRTIGKRIMGLKVIDKSETREIGFSQAFYRDSIPLIGTILVYLVGIWLLKMDAEAFPNETDLEMISEIISTSWFILEIGTALFNPKRRAVHDFVAGTVVIKL